MEELNEPEN